MITLQDSIQEFRPTVELEKTITRNTLDRIRHLGFASFILGMGVTSVLYFFPYAVPELTHYRNISAGISLLGLAIWIDAFLGKSYHNSYYFRGLKSILGLEEEPQQGATYDVAKAVLRNEHDVAAAFVTSTFGQTTLLRCNIPLDAINDYQKNTRQPISANTITLPKGEIFSLIGLGKYILTHDAQFVNLLKQHGVREETFLDSLRWVVGSYHEEKRSARWWSRDTLSKTEGIGRELSSGIAYTLQKYARDIRTSAVFSTLTRDSAFAAEKVAEIEQTLAKSKASNVLLVGEAGVGKMDLVMEVARRMKTGEALAAIRGEHIYVLDTNRLFATHKDKQSLELTLITMFEEAAAAGHTIVVIENISTFIKEAEALGVYVPELLDTYLSIPDIHFIVTETPGAYHTNLETIGGFVRRFSEILIEIPNQEATVRVLQKIALQEEYKNNLLITYPALVATAEAADRYIVEGVMPDKAISLLLSVDAEAVRNKAPIVTDDMVFETVSKQTGVPAGPIGEEERDLLLHLEDKLHRLVVGQQRALNAIATTMRRARAGIQSSDKPIGSFLFLGPTGVGKTETAKALATVFFGGEQNLRRLDMSEYSGLDGVERLIGNSEHAGSLPTLLREHPYSVVLLDEFEKAAQPVHDIFLQVLDEGKFTDGRGQTINARNCIMIATSNAGSRLILETVQSRNSLHHLNDEIVQHIIQEGLFRPELINRFDSTIIFEPLNQGEQSEVASMMLKSLYERVRDRGYGLRVTDDLLALLVERGYDPEFGARPMQRAIQDIIEEAVAQKIIAGNLTKGETIILSREDIEPQT